MKKKLSNTKRIYHISKPDLKLSFTNGQKAKRRHSNKGSNTETSMTWMNEHGLISYLSNSRGTYLLPDYAHPNNDYPDTAAVNIQRWTVARKLNTITLSKTRTLEKNITVAVSSTEESGHIRQIPVYICIHSHFLVD